VVAAAVRLRASGGATGGDGADQQALDETSMGQLFVVLQDHADALQRLQEVLRRCGGAVGGGFGVWGGGRVGRCLNRPWLLPGGFTLYLLNQQTQPIKHTTQSNTMQPDQTHNPIKHNATQSNTQSNQTQPTQTHNPINRRPTHRRDLLDVEVIKGGPRDQGAAPAGLGMAVLEAA